MSLGLLFYIEPYVYISFNHDKILLFNTLNNKHIESNQRVIINLITKLVANNGVVPLTIDCVNNKFLKSFINKARLYYIGDVTNVKHNSNYPINILPDLKFMTETEVLNNPVNTIYESINSLYFFINNKNDLVSIEYNNLHTQFINYYANNSEYTEIHLHNIINIIDSLHNSSLTYIHISGGNLLHYSEIEGLINFLKNRTSRFKIIFNIFFTDLTSFRAIATLFHNMPDYFNINVIFDGSVTSNVLASVSKILNSACYEFVIQSNRDIKIIEKQLDFSYENEHKFSPYYNHNNKTFITNLLLIKSKKQIFNQKLSIPALDMKSRINSNFYGKIFIYPDGRVHANPNSKSLGNIYEENISDIIFKEVKDGESWKMVRKHLNPCKGCLYSSFCPPISNYEIVLKTNNMCNFT